MPQSQANPQPFDPPLTDVSLQTASKAIHIIDVRLETPPGKLLNDSDVPITPAMINNGLTIQILCDAPVDPVSVQPSTCFVTC